MMNYLKEALKETFGEKLSYAPQAGALCGAIGGAIGAVNGEKIASAIYPYLSHVGMLPPHPLTDTEFALYSALGALIGIYAGLKIREWCNRD